MSGMVGSSPSSAFDLLRTFALLARMMGRRRVSASLRGWYGDG